MRALVLAALVNASCSLFVNGGDPATDASGSDADSDEMTFGAARLIEELSVSSAADDDPSLTGDLLQIFFNSDRNGGAGGGDIWTAQRADAAAQWGIPEPVTELNSTGTETTPDVSADGFTIYFASDRPTTGKLNGNRNLYVATRPELDAAWSDPVLVEELSSQFSEAAGSLALGGTMIFFCTNRAGNSDDVYYSQLEDVWTTPLPAPGVSEPSRGECEPHVSEDALSIYFSFPSPSGDFDLHRAVRSSVDGEFELSDGRVEPLNTPSEDNDPWVSEDESLIFFSSERNNPGRPGLYFAKRP